MGCLVSKGGIQNYTDFMPKIKIPSHKLSIILENKVLQKSNLLKNSKNCSPKSIFVNEKYYSYSNGS
jgi:hypothetical protein